MVHGLAFALRLLDPLRAAGVINDVFLPDPRMVGRFQPRTLTNRIATAAINPLLKIGPVRRAALGASILDLDALRRSEAAREQLIAAATGLSHHVSFDLCHGRGRRIRWRCSIPHAGCAGSTGCAWRMPRPSPTSCGRACTSR